MAEAAAPPRFPIMFIVPDKVPALRPPTSMQAPHEPGMTRSFEKLAKASATTASTGLPINVEITMRLLAHRKPTQPSRRRVAVTLPVIFVRGLAMKPEKRH